MSLIAVDGDVCASMAVYWPVAMRVGDEVVPGAQGMEAVTHPDYRNRPRLFLTLAKQGRDLALERMQLMYTFPNVRSIKLTKHVGATYLGEVGGWGIDLERSRMRLPRLSRRGEEPAAAPAIDELAALAARAHAQPGLVRIDKSAEWLSWRYSDATCENYQWVVERDASGALTAAALLGERDPARWGTDFAGIFRIHELYALEEQSARSVLRRSVDRVRGASARKLDVLVMLEGRAHRRRAPADPARHVVGARRPERAQMAAHDLVERLVALQRAARARGRAQGAGRLRAPGAVGRHPTKADQRWNGRHLSSRWRSSSPWRAPWDARRPTSSTKRPISSALRGVWRA